MINGGAILILTRQYEFVNNTIVDNNAQKGGGIYVESILGGSARGFNNILYGNTGDVDPNYSGDVTFTYSCVEGGMVGEGNIEDDPLFKGDGEIDYLLDENSPCRDSGDPDSPSDPDGSRADMGAFYYGYIGIPANPPDMKPVEFILHSCYPNPFNPLTTISFSLPQNSRVSLTVYDLSGNQISQLVNGYRYAGQHQVTFDASSLASGIYIYRLKAGEHSASGKMMLVK